MVAVSSSSSDRFKLEFIGAGYMAEIIALVVAKSNRRHAFESFGVRILESDSQEEGRGSDPENWKQLFKDATVN